jgi:hypothetical protein
MSFLRKLLPPLFHKSEKPKERKPFVLNAGTQINPPSRRSQLVPALITLVVAVVFIVLWVISLVSPHFDITPVELAPDGQAHQRNHSLRDAFQEVGAIIDHAATPIPTGSGLDSVDVAELEEELGPM